jgi:uncharacterized protein
MGRYGHYVIDADGHGGEPLGWRRRVPERFHPQVVEYVRQIKAHYSRARAAVPGAGMQAAAAGATGSGWATDDFEVNDPRAMRPGMYDPVARLEDMDLEGIDVAVLFPPGSGEEFALHDAEFSAALCRALNDARAEYAAQTPERLKVVAKLPMIDPEAAVTELERCVRQHRFVGLVTAQHVLDKNLDHPSFDPVWEAAAALDVAVCVHGGGQAPGQVPFVIERLDSMLTVHAFTHPVGAMLAVTSFTVGGVLARHPGLRAGFLEAGAGWLPFWLDRLDDHWEQTPDLAPAIDRAPSSYFKEGCFVSCEPDERTVPHVLAEVTPESVCYASDYCHWDCAFPDTVRIINERTDLDDGQKTKLLAGNAGRLYGLPVPAGV